MLHDYGVMILLFGDLLFVLFGFIAFVVASKIALFWDSTATTPLQYKLIKQSPLFSSIVRFLLIFKIFFFFYFIATLDRLSNMIQGAMCAVGVIGSVDIGEYLVLLKVIDLYLFSFWLLLHHEDSKRANQPFMKLKALFFVAIFFLIAIEAFLEYHFFSQLRSDILVSCCNVVFDPALHESFAQKLLHLSHQSIIAITATLFGLLVLFFLLKQTALYAIASLLFAIFNVFGLISYFGTYIYELPTHHCPFCMLQGDYYYIGYIIYTLLFLGSFWGMAAAFTKEQKHLKRSLTAFVLYIMIIAFYPLKYYLENGVWLY